jgi:hypothetical protein
MVAKCANPQCNQRFMRSDEGKLFFVKPEKPGPAIENLFWLCRECASAYTVTKNDQTNAAFQPDPARMLRGEREWRKDPEPIGKPL